MVNESQYNEDELHTPEWMNNEFFEKVVKNIEPKSKVKILDYVISPGTAKSDHYASVMYRTKVKYTVVEEEKQRSFIIKCLPFKDGYKKDKISNLNLFDTEIKMYTETIPKIEAILRQHGDNTKLCADLIHHQSGAESCIVFEDLGERGFAPISGRDCTLAEVKAAYERLAKIHAVSYKLAQEGDLDVTSYKEGIFNTLELSNMEFIVNAITLFKEVISSDDELRHFVPHVEQVEADLLEKCVYTFNAYVKHGEREGIFVLNHGDFHMKNMLVKYDQGEFKDLMLVDYQVPIFASPAVDLFYSFPMLMSPPMRRNRRDELFYFYFMEFQKVLKTIDFKGHIPTLSEFRIELDKHKHWELFIFMSFLLINYVFRDGEGDLQKFVEDESYRRKLFTRPQLLYELRVQLPRFLYAGYFE